MKVLVDGIPYSKGGIGTLILNMYDCAETKTGMNKIDFEFIVPKESSYISVLKQRGAKYYIAPPVHNIKSYRAFLSDLFENNRFDYLWFNNTCKVNKTLPKYAKSHGTKVISHPHGVDIEEKGIKRLVFKVLDKVNEKVFYSLVDVPFSCSEEAADRFYVGSKELRSKTTIIKNGIFTSRFSFSFSKRTAIRKELGISDSDFLLGLVGRLTPVKNYPFAIDLLANLGDNYKMIILGDGEDREVLRQYINDKKEQDRCFLLGNKEDIPDYLSAMDCFLMPSFYEGFPFSVVEAQCEGLPCFITNTLSKELKLTDLVSFLPLEKPIEWIESIKGIKNKKT